jgi:hypothetical protein
MCLSEHGRLNEAAQAFAKAAELGPVSKEKALSLPVFLCRFCTAAERPLSKLDPILSFLC